MLEVPCKHPERPKEKSTIRIPVVLPHELLNWLAQSNRFRIDGTLIQKFWRRYQQFKPSHPAALGGQHNPLGIGGDDARYTLGGAKVIVICMSLLLLDQLKKQPDHSNDLFYSSSSQQKNV